MIWYSWYNNQLSYYTWLDATIFTLWHLIHQPTYLYTTWSLSLCYNTWYNNLNYYYTTRIQQAFLCPYDTMDTILISYILQLIQQPNTMITLIVYITWYNKRYAIWIQKPIAFLSMNKATARPLLLEDPHRCAYQERLGGRHATIQDYEFRVIILFFSVLPFVLFDIRLSEDP